MQAAVTFPKRLSTNSKEASGKKTGPPHPPAPGVRPTQLVKLHPPGGRARQSLAGHGHGLVRAASSLVIKDEERRYSGNGSSTI
eukprot:2244879-Rhodomonas_salina.1